MFRVVLVFSSLFLILNCAGNKPKGDWTASDYYHYAKEMFDEEDYYDASNEFTVVVLRFAGTSVADSAQFYLAESHFMMDEFLIAAVEYEKLINSMGKSPLVPRAQYKLAESYFQLSPRPSLDQQYTNKAIRSFQTFIEDYPRDEQKEDAEKRIAELRDRLAEKAIASASVYQKMREYDAAIIYYDKILEQYYDSAWADDALLGKIETYISMEDFDNAAKEIEKFSEQFPGSENKDKVDKFVLEVSEQNKQEK